MKFEIKNRWSGAVQFECELSAEMAGKEYSLQLGFAVKKAVEAGAYLAGAYLAGANLAGANLAGAYLAGAYLAGANLAGANLAGAYLAGANLAGAYLAGANLAGANLASAYLAGAYLADANLADAYLVGDIKLIGRRPFMAIGPIGSRCSTFYSYVTDKGIRLQAGCFFGTVAEFREKLILTHGDNDHGAEYEAALALIEKHAELWTPPAA